MKNSPRFVSLFRFLPALLCVGLAGGWTTAAARATFEKPLPGVGIEGNVISVAVPIHNSGDTEALDVRIDEIELHDGKRTAPRKLPIRLGRIDADQEQVINLSFDVRHISLGLDMRHIDRRFPPRLEVEGSFRDPSLRKDQHRRFEFKILLTIPPAAPGAAAASTGTLKTRRADGPHAPVPAPQETGETNEAAVPTPQSPLHDLFPRTLQHSEVHAFPGLDNNSAAVSFVKNTEGNGVFLPMPPDPSAASSGRGQVVLATGNLFVKYSVDGGGSFNTVSDLSTVFGDNPDGGYCCDQVAHYVPSIDRIVWLIQTKQVLDAANNVLASNRLRVAWAKPADIRANFFTAWTWVDVSSTFLGLGNDWLDFPDLATSSSHVYFSVDDVNQGGLVVMRIAYSDIAANSGSVNVDFTDPTKATTAFASHLMQNSADTMRWAGHNGTDKLRVFSWPDGSGQYSWSGDIKFNGYKNDDYVSKAPDQQFWLVPKPKGDNIVAAVRKPFVGLVEPGQPSPPSELWFGWTAGRDASVNRAHPYVKIVKFNEDNLAILGELDIWNPDFAYAYPALAANSSTGEVAVSLLWGGGGNNFMNHAVGFLGDFVVYVTTASDVTMTTLPSQIKGACNSNTGGVATGRCTRSGDYLSLRRVGTESGLFGTLGYEVKLVDPTKSTDCTASPGCRQDVHYVEFGRPSDASPPAPGPR